MGEAVGQGRGHLAVSEAICPFAEVEVCGYDDAGAFVEMGWLPPSPNGIAMCQDGGLRTTKWRGRQIERYNDRGGSGKECVPAPRSVDDGRRQVSQEADAG